MLSEEKKFELLIALYPDTIRMPPGLKKYADAIEAAVLEEQVKEGMVLVPREPTEEMLEAGARTFDYGGLAEAEYCWKAMLTAAEKEAGKCLT